MKDHKVVSYQLHGFSDASEKAFAAVVYLRVEYKCMPPDIRLVASKTRVAPVKKQSIPRLELLGATILVRLMERIVTGLDSPQWEHYYWTDSYTTLCWIRNDQRWKQYVQHRVDEIHKLSDPDRWRFCPGLDNPADLPSRGCSGEELADSISWWHGPSFLSKQEEFWPNILPSFKSEEASKEAIKNMPKVVHALTSLEDSKHLLPDLEQVIDITRFSSKIKLLRMTALVLKFVKLLKESGDITDSRSILPQEVAEAEQLWIKSIQAKHIVGNTLTKERLSYVLKQLNVRYDQEGILRCYGRITNAVLPNESKNPILLPTKHYFTELLIQENHFLVHHDGIRETLNAIRESYWIVCGREAVKQKLRKCVVCKKYEGRPYSIPLTSVLPTDRVADVPPFTNTGVDFAGPLYTKNSHDHTKVYVCLFTCSTTRAVHLELVDSLAVPQFLQAFHRFVGCRGLQHQVRSRK